MMKIGSLFDGSGGFPLAGVMRGGIPVWRSEVEPYPIAVTKSRFPNMVHLGDVSKVKGDEVEPVDIITFGSPCQDLSVAGKRAGLKHEENGDEETTRSGLFMEAIRIIKEMRKATNGLYPTFAIWENVPGAFSSNKGEDFRVVLEEFVKISEPSAKVPPIGKGGWPYADTIVGDGWSIAYRVFDAQYWGVPQRRRRIYLVADFRGQRAAEILFEREGLRGYFEKGGETWQTAATDAEGSTGADDKCIVYCLQGNGIDRADTAGCNGKGWREDVGYTLNTIDRPAVVYAFEPGAARRLGGYVNENITGTLRAEMGDNQVAVAYGFPLGFRPENVRLYEDTATTLCNGTRAGFTTGVVYAVENHPADSRVNIDESGKCQTLTSRMGTGGGNVPMVMEKSYCLGSGKDVVGTLMANAGTKLWLGNQEAFSGDYCIVEKTPVHYIVRRLTPTECARLQGFPDKWGHPDKKESLTDEEYLFWLDVRNTHAAINGKAVKEYSRENMLKWYNKLHTDSSEYKMWGNGIALPNALYVMQGIAEQLKKGYKDGNNTAITE